ncbi:MAG: class I SAM-dependent methyltransferase [Candidatus Hodarchaeota archaeon]
MDEVSNRTEKWKTAQKSELEFQRRLSKRKGFSKDFSKLWKRRFRRFDLPKFDKKSILEVGCNISGPLHFLQGTETFKVGIDPLWGKLFKEIATKDIHYMGAVGENLPLATEKFDVVLSHNVLDHVIAPEKVVGEIHRVLKETGRFLLCVHSFSYMVKLLEPIIKIIDRRHPYHFSAAEVYDLLNSCGFNIVRFTVINGYDVRGTLEKPSYHYLLELLKTRRFKAFFSSFVLRTVYVTAEK